MRFMKNHRALMMAGGLALTFCCGCAAGTAGLQNLIEYGVASAADQTGTEKKGEVEQKDIMKEVGQKDSKVEVEQKDVVEIDEDKQARISLQEADYYLEEMADAPLLEENADPKKAGYADCSLETSVNDINATNCAGNIIRELCQKDGVDVNKAKVKDLTKEQIAQIDLETFRQSEHGK